MASVPIIGTSDEILRRRAVRRPGGRKQNLLTVRCAAGEVELWQDDVRRAENGPAMLQRFHRSHPNKSNEFRPSVAVVASDDDESQDTPKACVEGTSSVRARVALVEKEGCVVELRAEAIAAELGVDLNCCVGDVGPGPVGRKEPERHKQKVVIPRSSELKRDKVLWFAEYSAYALERGKKKNEESVRAFFGFVKTKMDPNEVAKFGMTLLARRDLIDGYSEYLDHETGFFASTRKNKCLGIINGLKWMRDELRTRAVGEAAQWCHTSQVEGMCEVVRGMAEVFAPEARKQKEDTLSLEQAIRAGLMCTSGQLRTMLEWCNKRLATLLEKVRNEAMESREQARMWYEFEMVLLWYIEASMPVQRREVFEEMTVDSLMKVSLKRKEGLGASDAPRKAVYTFRRLKDKNLKARLKRNAMFLRRTVVLSPECTPYLDAWLEEGRAFMRDFLKPDEPKGPTRKLFLKASGAGVDGWHITNLTKKVSKILCGVAWTPLDLRHLRCSLFYYGLLMREDLTLDEKRRMVEKYSTFIANEPETFYRNYVFKSASMQAQEGFDILCEANEMLSCPARTPAAPPPAAVRHETAEGEDDSDDWQYDVPEDYVAEEDLIEPTGRFLTRHRAGCGEMEARRAL